MKAMSNAAVDAGLISGTLPAQKREAALFKLMEQGKLISSQVLPHFGRQLRSFANDNDALTKALDQNLSPALGTAMNHFVEMQNAFFQGGWKQNLLFLTDNFNDQADAMKALSGGLGSLAGEVFSNLVGPLQLALATIMDIKAALDMDVRTEDKASDIGGTLKKALPEMNKYFKKMPLLSPSAFAGDMVNSVADMFPDSGFKMAAPYVPSATLSSYSPRGSRTPIPVQITVTGTDGLIEVVEATVNDANNSMLEDALGTINGGD